MTLPKLKTVATQLGVDGAAKMKKDALVEAIADLQAKNREAAKAEREARREARNNRKKESKPSNNTQDSDDDGDEDSAPSSNNDRSNNDRGNNDRGGRFDRNDRGRGRDRNRDRNRDRAPREEREPVIGEDDVLVPVGGLLDILESYAFIRTGGYLPGPNDVYVSLQQVRKNGLRKGDVVTGQVRQPREGETKQKFNALITLETVNGMTPEEARNRVEFGKLTPLYPQERLRLETEPNILTTRVIDLIAPIGKGQRGLIVSPPKAGKTMVLQSIANAITTNNPECHLMVVLVRLIKSCERNPRRDRGALAAPHRRADLSGTWQARAHPRRWPGVGSRGAPWLRSTSRSRRLRASSDMLRATAAPFEHSASTVSVTPICSLTIQPCAAWCAR